MTTQIPSDQTNHPNHHHPLHATPAARLILLGLVFPVCECAFVAGVLQTLVARGGLASLFGSLLPIRSGNDGPGAALEPVQ